MQGAPTDQALLQVLMLFFSFDLYNKPVGGLDINRYAFRCNNEDIYCVNKEYRGSQRSFRGLYPNAAHSQSTFDHFLRLSHPLANANSCFCFFFSSSTLSPFSVPVLLSSQPLQDSQAREAGVGRFQFCPPCPLDATGITQGITGTW